MTYKIIACDIDHTLLNEDLIIPQVNIDAIKKAAVQGKIIALASGRGFNIVQKFNQELKTNNDFHFSICHNGAAVNLNGSGQFIFFDDINYDVVEELFKIGLKYNVYIMLFTNHVIYTFNNHGDEVRYNDPSDPIEMFTNSDISFLKKESIEKVVFEKGDGEYLKNIVENLGPIKDKLEITFSSEHFVEFNSKGVSKGNALNRLCTYLNIDIEDSIAIGDNLNDLEMIESAGLGCAVSNASQELKEKADYICEKSNNEGAIAEVIEKFLLDKE